MSKRERKGCFVTQTSGFILLFLAVVLTVGVGLIVHFTSTKSGATHCNCIYPELTSELDKQTKDSQIQFCNSLGKKENKSVVLTVGVALIVHFTSTKSGATHCNCIYPASTSGLDKQREGSQIQFCDSLGQKVKQCFGSQQCKEVTVEETTTPPGDVKQKPRDDIRIPAGFTPLHYNIELRPHIYSGRPEDFSFDGYVEIYLTCNKATDKLYLHMNQLEMNNSTIMFRAVDDNDTPPDWSHWTYDKVRQFFVLHLRSSVTVGKQYVFKVRYIGKLADDLRGFYRSSYTKNHQTRWLATTMFAPTDARKAFPCFDEPAMKATFNITLVRKSNKKALSNMPIYATTQRAGDWYADQFEKTVKMSTYLLAFVVCDFTYKEAYTSRGTRYRVWARPDAVDAGQVDYALDIGVRILTYWEDFFNIPFPLPKQDMAAIPDFRVGGMENWGLILYRERALLYDPQESSSKDKQRIAIVVAHEISHQWFGNLVTPAWWDELWLKEGFSSYLHYLGVDFVHADWNMLDQFVEDEVQAAFVPDGLASSHPVYVPVEHPNDILAIFDIISYKKGAAIIRMMASFLGRDTFQRGLTNYLNNNAYNNANQTDLWVALGNQARMEGSDVSVPEVMDTWVLQMGYPVVTVNINRQSGSAQISQKHFLMDDTKEPDPKYPSAFGYKWMIPFTYTTDVDRNWSDLQLVWMQKSDVTLSNLPSDTKWIIGNIGQHGYYRMNYDEETWQNIIQQLSSDHQVIPVSNRAQLIDDAFTLGRSGMIDQLVSLQLISYMKKEMDFVPWSSALYNIAYITSMFGKSQVFGSFQKFMTSQIKPVYDQIGRWSTSETDSHLQKRLRALMIDALCSYGDEECLNEASAVFARWMKDPDGNGKIDPDLRSLTYCYGIQTGAYLEWEFVFNRYKNESNVSEKIALLYALSCTGIPWILHKYMELTLDSVHIRKQDSFLVFSYVSENPIGNHIVWDILRSKFRKIYEAVGGLFGVSEVVTAVTSGFNTEYACEQINNFMRENANDLGAAKRPFEQALEKCNSNVKWMNTNLDKITNWLQQQI